MELFKPQIRDKGFMPILKRVSSKLNTIARLQFEVVYNDIVI